VVARAQLLELGMPAQAIKHRVATGRLHPVERGVYVVGSPHVSRRGRWMAAVLCCGLEAALSHGSAAALWEIRRGRPGVTEVSVPRGGARGRRSITVHPRFLPAADLTRRDQIPVTSPARTLIDLGGRLRAHELEAAVNEADKLDLIDVETLRATLAERPGVHGAPALREVLDHRTFALTDSELERRFLRLVRQAGLPRPHTGPFLNGFKVDFFWPELGLVVETDGLRYHRTPGQQARDRERDQAHAAAGLTPLRFTHAQIRFEAKRVRGTLVAVARRLRSGAPRAVE
jgi:very-short-patch-repair endonuclease